MGALSKRAIGARLMEQDIALFACPICQSAMHVYEQGRLVCSANHSFDIAKQGYVNMLTHGATSKYSKDLFESRKAVIDSGIYDAIEAKIAELLASANTILDTGCGEGSHLARIMAEKSTGIGVGIDIAKEGIVVTLVTILSKFGVLVI